MLVRDWILALKHSSSAKLRGDQSRVVGILNVIPSGEIGGIAALVERDHAARIQSSVVNCHDEVQALIFSDSKGVRNCLAYKLVAPLVCD